MDVTWSAGQLTLPFPFFSWLVVAKCFLLRLWLCLASMEADSAGAFRGSISVLLLVWGDEVNLSGVLDKGWGLFSLFAGSTFVPEICGSFLFRLVLLDGPKGLLQNFPSFLNE